MSEVVKGGESAMELEMVKGDGKSDEPLQGNLDNIDSLVVEDYFESYADFDVHRLMLQDTVRTNAYKDAINNAASLIKGKVVMDVGAGTGILSLFCAKAGAKKVYAVEASDLAKILPKVAEKNGYGDVIEVIHSKVEDVKLKDQVDILVSEWMGFYLLHESMLDSVVFARDKFLKPDGLMFPNSAQIYAAPCTVQDLWKNYHDFWTEKQYDFDLSPFTDMAKIKDKPEIACVPGDGLLSDPQLLWDLDLTKILKEDTEGLKCLKDRRFFSIEEDGNLQGVCIWFTCGFPPVHDQEDVTLSTAPWDPPTHWKQTVVLFPEQIAFEAGDIMGWEFMIEKASLEATSRSYRIHLKCLDADEDHGIGCLCGSVKCELIRHFMTNHPKTAQNTDNQIEITE